MLPTLAGIEPATSWSPEFNPRQDQQHSCVCVCVCVCLSVYRTVSPPSYFLLSILNGFINFMDIAMSAPLSVFCPADSVSRSELGRKTREFRSLKKELRSKMLKVLTKKVRSKKQKSECRSGKLEARKQEAEVSGLGILPVLLRFIALVIKYFMCIFVCWI